MPPVDIGGFVEYNLPRDLGVPAAQPENPVTAAPRSHEREQKPGFLFFIWAANKDN